MDMQAFSFFRDRDLGLTGIRIGVLVYVAVMFVPHTGAIRTLSLYLPLLLLLWRYLADGRWRALGQPILAIFTVWVLVHVPSVLYAPDLGYSVGEFHSSLLRALILALLIYEGFRDEVWLRLLFRWLGWLALGLALVFSYHVISTLLVQGMWGIGIARYGHFRGFGEALVLLLPMAWWNAREGEGWRKALFWGGTGVLLGLAFMTGSRGVLAGALIAFGLLMLVDRGRAAWLALTVSLALGALLFWFVFDPQVVIARLTTNSSGRMDSIWIPSIQALLRDAPWLGFGFGPSNFDELFREILSRNPDWSHRAGLFGLHNQWLLIAVQTGLLGLAASVLLWGGQLWIQFRTALLAGRAGALGGFVVLAALIGHYGVRGMIDTLGWIPLGLLVGMAAALEHRYAAGRDARR